MIEAPTKHLEAETAQMQSPEKIRCRVGRSAQAEVLFLLNEDPNGFLQQAIETFF